MPECSIKFTGVKIDEQKLDEKLMKEVKKQYGNITGIEIKDRIVGYEDARLVMWYSFWYDGGAPDRPIAVPI